MRTLIFNFILFCMLYFSYNLIDSKDKFNEDWPVYRGDPGYSGLAKDNSIKPPLKLLWSYRMDSDTSGDANSGPIIGDGKLYQSTYMERSVVAIDSENGSFCWEYVNKFINSKTILGYYQKKVYIWIKKRHRVEVICLNSSTGKQVWLHKLNLGENIMTRRTGPVFHNNKLYIVEGGEKPALKVLNPETGAMIVSIEMNQNDGNFVSGPCIAGSKIFMTTKSKVSKEKKITGAVFAYDLNTGKELWRNNAIYSSAPLVSDGKIVICKVERQVGIKANSNQKLYVLDANTGKENWSIPIKILYGTSTILSEKIILKGYGLRTKVLDRKTGKTLATFNKKGGSGCASPIVSGNFAYFGTGSFNDSEGIWAWRFTEPPHTNKKYGVGVCWTLHAMDINTGKSVWQFITGNNVCGGVAIAKGRLYVNSRDGRIYCFEPVEKMDKQIKVMVDNSIHTPKDLIKKLANNKGNKTKDENDWLMEGNNIKRNGSSKIVINTKPKLTWKFELGGRIVSSFAIINGVVFAGSTSGKIIALDLESGNKKWLYDGKHAVKCSPAVSEDLLYIGTDGNELLAMDINTGSIKWKFKTGGPVQCSPAILGDVLVFGANDYHIYLLNRITGKLLWKFKTESEIVKAPPVIYDGKIYAAGWRDWLYCIDLFSGEKVWQSCVPISLEYIAVYREKVYLRSPYQLCEYDPKNGKRLRIANIPYGYNGFGIKENIFAFAGVNSGMVLDIDMQGELKNKKIPNMEEVLVLKSKKRLKGFPSLANSSGTPLIVSEERILWPSKSGKIKITKYDGTTLDSFKLESSCHSSPVVSNGIIIIGDDHGIIYGYR